MPDGGGDQSTYTRCGLNWSKVQRGPAGTSEQHQARASTILDKLKAGLYLIIASVDIQFCSQITLPLSIKTNNFMSTVKAQYWLIRNINVKMYRKFTIENVTSLSIVRISVVAFY